MKQRNPYPWLKGRSFTNRPEPNEPLHPRIDRKKLRRLTQRIERSLLRQLAQPVAIAQVGERRSRVRVLRLVTAEVDAYPLNRFIGFRLHEISSENDGSIIETNSLNPDLLCLNSLLPPYDLAAGYAARWQLAIPSLLYDVPEPNWHGAYYDVAEWLNCYVEILVRKVLNLNAVNRQFSTSMGLNRRALAIARHLNLWTRRVYAWSYETVRRDWDWFCRIQSDDAKMIWLGDLLHYERDWNRTMEPVAAIRDLLIRRGLSPKGWRLLLRTEPDYWCGLIGLGNRRAESLLPPMIDWIERHVRNGLEHLVPEQTAFRFWNVIDQPQHRLEPRAIRSMSDPVFRIVCREVLAQADAGTLEQWMEDAWPSFIEWLVQHPEWKPDHHQARRGWQWLVAKIEQSRLETELRRREAYSRWTFALNEFATAEFDAVALPTADALRDEGQHMCHCVGDYVAAAAEGERRHFSIRQHNDGRRVATLELVRAANDDAWALSQCRGRQNADVAPDLMAFATSLAEAYNEAAANREERAAA